MTTNALNRFHIAILLFSLALISCRSAQDNSNQRAKLQTLADQTLGPDNYIDLNEIGSFALCVQKPGNDHARRKYRYIVVRMKDVSIVKEGSFSMGYAKWVGNTSIEVFSQSVPGRKQDGSKEIIDVNSQVQ